LYLRKVEVSLLHVRSLPYYFTVAQYYSACAHPGAVWCHSAALAASACWQCSSRCPTCLCCVRHPQLCNKRYTLILWNGMAAHSHSVCTVHSATRTPPII
jgi:hypothetical protein